MYVDTGDTLGGMFRSPRTPVRLTGCVESPGRDATDAGAAHREVLCSIGGMTPEEVESLEAEGAL